MAVKTNARVFGFNPPFIGGPQNILSRQEDDKIIKNDLLQLLLTVPGERVHRPTWGVNLRDFVFEQLTEADLLILREDMLEAIGNYETRIVVRTLNLIPDEANNGLVISLVFSLVNDPRRLISISKLINGIEVNE
jgi:phage baseplate assembly protein W